MFISKIIQNISILKKNAGLSKILFNISWLFADKVLRMGFGLIVGVWGARYLGAKGYGILNYAMAFVYIFNPIATLGLDAVVVRRLVANPEQQEKIMGTSFLMRFIAGWITWIVTIISIYLLRSGDLTTILTVIIFGSINVFQSLDTIDLWFQSQVQSKYSVVAKNIAFVIATALKITLILLQAPFLAFIAVSLSETILGAIGLLLVYNRQGYFTKLWQWSGSLARSLLHESLPLILSGLTIMIYMRIDQIMLGQMIGDKAVGVYSAATRISEIWYFVPTAVSSSVMPSIFKIKEVSEDLYYQRIGQLNRWLVWTSIVVAGVMTFAATPVTTMLYGQDYVEAGSILAVHIWASIFVFTGVATYGWFIAENFTDLLLYRALSGAIVNVILNWILIPIYGGLGAAIATVIAQAVASLLFNSFNSKTRNLFFLQISSLLPIKLK
jgi:polysaccharide transporter, PST family